MIERYFQLLIGAIEWTRNQVNSFPKSFIYLYFLTKKKKIEMRKCMSIQRQRTLKALLPYADELRAGTPFANAFKSSLCLCALIV